MTNVVYKSKKKRKIPADILSHVNSYILVNALLICINIFPWPPDYLWFVWVSTGWGLGLIFHIVIRLIVKRQWRSETKFLAIHFVIFIVMSLYFLFIDTFTGMGFTNSVNWCYFPITAWFSLFFAHFLSTLFIQIRSPPEDINARKRYYLINAFIVHVIIFFCVNTYLLIINFLTGYDFPWHFWPLAAMILALSIHLFITIIEIFPMRNIQLKILLYHCFLFFAVSGYLIFEDLFRKNTLHWWYYPVGGWLLGILIHLIYYFLRRAKK